ncbi:MAG: tRNA pseudouridine(55) synthase TruB [Gammaproteobacteria bacterium]|nr:tRNA pseudouridine(55) synthase TruB [Gammaproteobacteria bacterium]
MSQSQYKSKSRAVNGILILDKPKGMSSNFALQKVKRLFNAKKAGHTGSLDPLATGVLPICFGSSTKLCQNLLDSDKKYLVTAQLGQTTATGDAEGEVINDLLSTFDFTEVFSDGSDNSSELEAVVKSFLGQQEQVPSMYSALKHNGVPLYKLARQGITVPRAARTITIYTIELISLDKVNKTIELLVHCSKGTYIRTLVEDIGNKIGCGAYVLELRRTTAGPYDLETSVTLDCLTSNTEYSMLDQLLL